MNDAGAGTAMRLRPDMASLRLIALRFVRDYIARWGASPSYGEIAAALDTNRTRVRKAVKSLAADGLLLRTPGARGLALPDNRDAALRVLRALGWSIDNDALRAEPPADVTNPPLQPAPVLDYVPAGRGGGPDGAQGEESGGG